MLPALSLPLWECGLKYAILAVQLMTLWSLPLWECGLKSYMVMIKGKHIHVTPLVGVWIEIAL